MNLLPDSRKKVLAQLYLVRLVVVASLVIAGVLCVHVALMAPNYLHARQERITQEAALLGIGEALSGTEEKQVSDRVKALNDSATYLVQAAASPRVSKAIRAVSEVPHTGVRVTGFSFTGAQGSQPARMTISGVASSRATLREYVATLKTLPYVSSVDIPIGAYAKETDISFTVTLAGSFNI